LEPESVQDSIRKKNTWKTKAPGVLMMKDEKDKKTARAAAHRVGGIDHKPVKTGEKVVMADRQVKTGERQKGKGGQSRGPGVRDLLFEKSAKKHKRVEGIRRWGP